MKTEPASQPHYLRFVRALAATTLVGSTALFATSCASTTGQADTQVTDATDISTPPTDADPCSLCNCPGLTTADVPPPYCTAPNQQACCAVIGPLAPPELPAFVA